MRGLGTNMYDGMPKTPRDEPEDLGDQLSALIAKLETEAKRRVDRRRTIEDRWIEDLQQYHGVYPDEHMGAVKDRTADPDVTGSRVFLNMTRPKTNAMIARLWDLLFPTDDRNWSIQPTPVPDLTDGAEEAMKLADDAEDAAEAKKGELKQAAQAGDEAQIDEAANEAAEAEEIASAARKWAEKIELSLAEARERCDLMQEEILDQLKTCSYQAEARDVIEDACKVGIGIMKGPVIGERMRRRFQSQDGMFVLVEEPSPLPAAYRVDYWSFFPDPDARRPEDSNGFYERHLLNKQTMRKLARRPDIDKDAARALLTMGPQGGSMPTYLVDLHNLTGQDISQAKDCYHVWEYRGPLDSEDFELLAMGMGKDDMLDLIGEDADPLMELESVVWFCQGKVLSLAIQPLDSGEPIYSVYNLARDESSMFGYGVPYMIRDPQAILNAASRAMMDNAVLATGPQIVVNRDVVTPQDGHWGLTPRKVWTRNNSADIAPGTPPFETFNIPMAQAELAAIIEMAKRDIDDVTGMPAIAQGEQGQVTKTAQGMALLMNSANVVFKLVVKNWDDDVTVPLIRRFYHWNMQFNDKDAIKGDYDVDARGSSVLLVREMHSQNLLMMAQMFGGHPVFGAFIKPEELLKAITRAFMLPMHEVVMTEREAKAKAKETAAQPDPAAQAEMMKAQAMQADVQFKQQEIGLKAEQHNQEWDMRMRIAEMQYDVQMSKIAEALNMKQSELESRMAGASMSAQDRAAAATVKAQSDERKLAVEVAMQERTGKSSGGAV